MRGDAAEGRDYDPQRLSWLWRVTSEADQRIIEQNQQGVSSRYYRPGPYGPMERKLQRFVEWYVRQVS